MLQREIWFRSRKFNVDLLSNKTKRRICEFSLLDYCCSNLPLPVVCQGFFCILDKDGKVQPGILP